MEANLGSDSKTGWEANLLPNTHIDHYWENISQMLDRVPHTWEGWTKEVLYERALDGDIQVWGIGTKEAHRAFMFTQIAAWPTKRILEVIWYCGTGTLDDGLDILDAMGTRFAQIQGCTHIEIIGRKGWEPVAKARGFRVLSTRYSRRVEGNLQ